MKRSLLTLLATSALALPSLHAADKDSTMPAPTPAETLSAPAPETTTSETANVSDKQSTQSGIKTPLNGTTFAKKAAAGGMAEIECGQLAVKKASSGEVKAFGALMVKDHTAANEKLMAIAAAKKIELPATLDDKHEKDHHMLASLSGSAFDKAYVDAMVGDHEKAVMLFKDASANLSDKELKAFAVATLPTLEMHLKKITAIQKSL